MYHYPGSLHTSRGKAKISLDSLIYMISVFLIILKNKVGCMKKAVQLKYLVSRHKF